MSSPPRAHFHQVALELLEQIVVRRDGDHGHVGIDQRQRPVLQLACGIGFGVNVRDFLELERAFHGDGGQCAAAQEQCVLLVGEPLGEIMNDRIQRQGLLDH